jgi:hypothetical protein
VASFVFGNIDLSVLVPGLAKRQPGSTAWHSPEPRHCLTPYFIWAKGHVKLKALNPLRTTQRAYQGYPHRTPRLLHMMQEMHFTVLSLFAETRILNRQSSICHLKELVRTAENRSFCPLDHHDGTSNSGSEQVQVCRRRTGCTWRRERRNPGFIVRRGRAIREQWGAFTVDAPASSFL